MTGQGIIWVYSVAGVCGKCQQQEWGLDLPVSVEEVQERLHRAGWKKTKRYGWVCPDCSRKE